MESRIHVIDLDVGDNEVQFYDTETLNTALHIAALDDQPELVEALVRSGFPVHLKNTTGQTALHLATSAGSEETCRHLLEGGADCLDVDANGVTPLQTAVSCGDYELVSLFLKHTTQRQALWTIFGLAILRDHESAVQAFLDNGFTFLEKNARTGGTLLHMIVIKAKHESIVKRLIEAGVVANATDCTGATALHIAAQHNTNEEIVRALVCEGADVNAVDRQFSGTPLFAAIRGKKIKNVKVLLELGANVSHTVPPGRSMLHVAAQDGVSEIMELLLEHAADPNILDELDGTAAQWAARCGHIDAIMIMLARGLDLRKDNGKTLAAALQEGHREIAELLLENGATMKLRNIHHAIESKKGRDMPLLLLCSKHAAVSDHDLPIESSSYANLLMSTGQFEAAAALVEYDGDTKGLSDLAKGLLLCICTEHGLRRGIKNLLGSGVSKRSKSYTVEPRNWTALHVAVFKGHLDLVKLFRANGWNMLAEDSHGNSALHLAVSEGYREIVEELLGEVGVRHGTADGNTPLHFAAASGDVYILKLLIEAGALVNRPNAGGQIPLHRACEHNHEDAAGILLQEGSNTAQKDMTGATPLHYAARYNSVEVLGLMVNFSVDLHPEAADGSTPLHHAAMYAATSVLMPFLDAGADPNWSNRFGKSPLEVAVIAGHDEVVKFLLPRTTIKWDAPRSSNIFFSAFQSRNKDIANRVLSALRSERGKKAGRVIRRLIPELLSELLSDRESPVAVLSLLLRYLPKEQPTRSTIAYYILLCVIKHSDDVELVAMLLEIDPTRARAASPGNWTPLHLACKKGRVEIVKILMRSGADLDAKLDGIGHTPLDIARKYDSGKVVVELIERYKMVQLVTEMNPQGRLAWLHLQD